MGIDAADLEANAAMRSIVRHDTAETYDEFLRRGPDRDADAGGSGAVGSEAQEANLEQGMKESSETGMRGLRR
jgi:hypothetical protein